MKHFLCVLLVVCFVSAQPIQTETSKDLSWSTSIGFSSEKIAISFYDGSILYNIDENSELYGTLTSIGFVSGIGLGYKYYIGDKSKSSIFVNTGPQIYITNDPLDAGAALSTAAGLSLKKTGETTSFNIGISLLFLFEEYNDGELLIPFINLQRRI